MNMDWRISRALNHLNAFESAVDHGSFTKAAEVLGTTQPSISRHVATLEQLLEVKLFERLHHRVELTPAGQELYDAVKLGLGHIRQAANRITTHLNPDTLSIGCTYGFAHLWLMPRFSALQKTIPDHDLRMITSDTRTLFDLDEIDFALRFGRGDWSDGQSQRLFGEELFPVCSPQFAQQHFAEGTAVDASMLTTTPLIHERKEEFSWLSWSQWLGHHSIDYTAAPDTYYYDSYALTLQAAIEGQGIALACLNLAEPQLTSGQLIELQDLRVKTDRGYYLAYRHHHAEADRIVTWFKDMAKSQEDVLL